MLELPMKFQGQALDQAKKCTTSADDNLIRDYDLFRIPDL